MSAAQLTVFIRFTVPKTPNNWLSQLPALSSPSTSPLQVPLRLETESFFMWFSHFLSSEEEGGRDLMIMLSGTLGYAPSDCFREGEILSEGIFFSGGWDEEASKILELQQSFLNLVKTIRRGWTGT